jgi:phosphate starvation-inducible PhoH-like protein
MARRVKNTRRATRNNEYQEVTSVQRNNAAILEGPQRKKWSKHDIASIQPKTPNQQLMFEQYFEEKHIIATGSPGTGKSFISLYLALCDIVNPDFPQTQIKIVRSAVASRDIGHLPGTAEEKLAEYEAPYVDILAELCGSVKTYEFMKAAKVIEFVSTSFIRGATWDDAIVFVDEAQNMTWHELNSVITRLGENSRLIIAGDTNQCDLNKRKEQTGFDQVIRVANNIEDFAIITFKPQDCVRSGFVRNWLHACERMDLI